VAYVLSTPGQSLLKRRRWNRHGNNETLRMEESRKGKGKDIAGSSSVNMVEDDKNKKNNKNSKGNKRKFHEKKNDSNKKSKMAC
nr:hypothetical protein [Tanacetum cinerariifolium]